ncbi:DUF6152 family protein [Bradyrhizobium sp. Ash2021]|uniref:DUF6152 family protein n=1 Tax=Bradyrhizobium sp. Ash2021 TaxID=2954771 RepID=UPI0028169D65|nr:DUF6152 family protein [Bradyrhizobium sp. Ash2021]WMT72670.1 DUF6152 family protein [Bradyrhizobium sp. Ash2021]
MSFKIVFLSVSLILGFIPGFGGIAAAHHSGAAYDLDHPQSVEGTVKAVNWTNPHITFVVEPDAKNAEPASTPASTSPSASPSTPRSTPPNTWVFEVSSPGVLTRSGWTKRSLQPGDHAVFRYAPLRDGNLGGFLLKVTLPSGQELSYSVTPAEQ